MDVGEEDERRGGEEEEEGDRDMESMRKGGGLRSLGGGWRMVMKNHSEGQRKQVE